MKHVLAHIASQAAAFAEEPLFAYLRDASVDPATRLKFVPHAAHFVMTFADLYRFFLPVESPSDPYEELANIHLSEDSSHWKWYLADLANIGMDPLMRFTDALRLVWSDLTIKTRRLSYEIGRLDSGGSSLRKLVIVQVIEATGKVTLEALAVAGAEFEARSGRRLVYFGRHHVDTERHHTLESDAVRRSLEGLSLGTTERSEMLALVDAAFGHFRGFADDSFRIAQSGSRISGAEDAGPSV
jgi:hypothetical protein